MNRCRQCPWLKRLLCVLACEEVNKILVEADNEQH